MIFVFHYVDMEPCEPQSDSFEAWNQESDKELIYSENDKPELNQSEGVNGPNIIHRVWK